MNIVFSEPWSSIDEYPDVHADALLKELTMELSDKHPINNQVLAILAKREDILVSLKQGFAIVHLTWSGKQENLPWPSTEVFKDITTLQLLLAQHADEY